jgi:branched-subunit amino acid ABC-type transport system permease component
MAEKLNKVALFIVLLVVIALIFGQLGFTKTQTGNAQSSITVNKVHVAEGGLPTASINVLSPGEKTAPEFYAPLGTAAAVLTVQPSK